MYAVALDGDGDRLVASQFYGTGGGGNKVGNVYTIKFDDTNFTNPQQVGSIGKGFSGTHDLAIASNTQELLGTGLALNDDGSRLAIGAQGDDGSNDDLNYIGAVSLVKFTDTSFSSPSLVGTIGADYTGTNDLDLSSDSSVTANRILGATDQFGSSVTLTKDNKLLKKKFLLKDDTFIAHSGGMINTSIYTNSLEALNSSYNLGARYFELDLRLTSDKKIVATHDLHSWKK